VRNALVISIAAFALMAPSSSGSAADPLVSSWQGHYVTKAGQGVGVDEAEVDLFPAYEGQAVYVDFMVAQNPPGRILGAVGPAYAMSRKKFSFSFKDNWGNEGRGTFSRHGEEYVLHLAITRESPSGPAVTDLYKDYRLYKKERKGRSDRHPWSLGKLAPNKSAGVASQGP
jgi:hypothetical protein